ncbi:FecCD family ABC transporter permease [Alloiococcus sp. CFN-8]|uniref:FecCD family ABC transporter permease n=1 Tax=Alloiococcus sp. CFN-8 TaxID=3416081 RepID=UPI003CF0AEC4
MKITRKKTIIAFLLTLCILLIAFFVAMNTGGLNVTVEELFRGLFIEYDERVAIILELRFPRIIVAILGGAIMAMSGVCMQAVMRNPLADPGIIGISSGAAFAAVIVSSFFPALAPFTPIFSFAGGMIAFFVVYALAWNKEISPIRLILTGIAVDAFFTGLYQAFNAFTGNSYTGAASIINANISLKTWEDVYVLCIYAVISLVLAVLVAGKCNLLSLSDKTVIGLGVNITKVRMIISIVAVLMASVFTAMVGAVSFLGLIVPHIARLLVGSDHKKLLPYSALLGSVIFLIADTLGRGIAYPYEISSAIIMAIIGGPMLIILLKRSGLVYGK